VVGNESYQELIELHTHVASLLLGLYAWVYYAAFYAFEQFLKVTLLCFSIFPVMLRNLPRLLKKQVKRLTTTKYTLDLFNSVFPYNKCPSCWLLNKREDSFSSSIHLCCESYICVANHTFICVAIHLCCESYSPSPPSLCTRMHTVYEITGRLFLQYSRVVPDSFPCLLCFIYWHNTSRPIWAPGCTSI
jgi:hypothetical protein